MDTRQLTDALREATDDLEPRAGFADDVLLGGRRRRTRGRIVVGTAIAVTAAVALAVTVGVPNRIAEPADPPIAQDGHPLLTSGGDLIDNKDFVALAKTTWREGIPHTPANIDGKLNQPLNEPHVTWAGTTPVGAAAIVSQQFTMPAISSVESQFRGQPAIAVGLLAAPDQNATRLALIGVQVEGHWARPGSFVFPDNRTVITVAYGSPPDSRVENISSNVRVGQDGVSRRDWDTPLRFADGVWIGELPAGTNPRNVRMIDSKPELNPKDAQARVMGLHHPLLFTSEYLTGKPPEIPDRGLPWDPVERMLGEDTHLRGRGWDRFQDAVRDSGLLDPTSYTDLPPHWTAVVGLGDGRTVLISSYQELDNPAYVFQVVIGTDDTVQKVTRGTKVELSQPLRLAVRLPGTEGWVVAVDPDKSLSYSTDGSAWSDRRYGAELIPASAVAVETSGQQFPLK